MKDINQLPNVVRSSDGPRQHINYPRYAHHNHQLQADTSQGGSVTDTNVCHFRFRLSRNKFSEMRNEKKKREKKMIRIIALTVPLLISRRRASTSRKSVVELSIGIARHSRTAESRWDRRNTRKFPSRLWERNEIS